MKKVFSALKRREMLAFSLVIFSLLFSWPSIRSVIGSPMSLFQDVFFFYVLWALLIFYLLLISIAEK